MSAKSFAVLALAALAAAAPSLKRQAPAPYLGCFTEADGVRALKLASTASPNMTHAMCEAFCLPTYKLFGVEYGSECYCGDTLEAGSIKVVEGDCNMACSGAAGEICGAGNRLSVFGDETAIPPSADPSTPPPANATYLGCYTEGDGVRALPSASLVVGTMDLDVCAQFCFDVKGYTVLGLEYGSECWCGNALDSTSVAAPGDCTMDCAGDNTQKCGAGNRLSVWVKN